MEQLDPHNLRSKSVGTSEGHTRNKYKTFNGINPLKNSFHNTLFLQEKEKGDKFFRNTKVGSCRKVLFKNGLSLAISFKIRNQKGEPLAKEEEEADAVGEFDFLKAAAMLDKVERRQARQDLLG